MNKISKKIIEAGLVDKHTLALIQKWGYLDGSVATQEERVRAALTEFVDELDSLLEAKDEEGIKETRFAFLIRDPMSIAWAGDEDHTFVVFHDFETENLIFSPETRPEVMNRFWVSRTKKIHTIEEVLPLWNGDTLYAYQVKYK